MNRLQGCYGFLGYGNMGEAILTGLLSNNILTADAVYVFDPVLERMEAARARGVRCVASPSELARACDTLLLAVKPQSLEEALAPLSGKTPPAVRVISIMAGISITVLQERFGRDARIIRVMPNTPALVGAGAAAIAGSANCNEEDIKVASAVFQAVGIAEVVPEAYMDAVTALSGSGPAYFFYLTECMIKAAVREGLPESLARRLAGQTLMGAGKLLVESDDTPETLRARVTSKGGTTFAATETLRARDFEGIVGEALHAAAQRSRELGR